MKIRLFGLKKKSQEKTTKYGKVGTPETHVFFRLFLA